MRNWLLVLLTCLVTGWLAAARPLPPRSPGEELQARAQKLVDDVLGPGQGRVTLQLQEGRGTRREQRTILGERGFAVDLCERREKYSRDSSCSEKMDEEDGSPSDAVLVKKGGYSNTSRKEHLELPRRTVHSETEHWIERISLAVVTR